MFIGNFLHGTVHKIFKTYKGNIKYKLFLIYLIVISIPISVFGVISYKMSSTVIEKDFINYKKRLNEQIVKNIEENIKNLTRQSMAIYPNLDDIIYVLNTPSDKVDTAYTEATKRVSRYFQSVLQSNDRLQCITLISLKGEILQYVNRNIGYINLYTVQDEPWFKETLSLKGFPLLREPHYNEFVYKSTLNKNQVISISRAVIDLDTDKSAGVILFDQDVSQFSGLFENVNIENGEIITVFGKTGDTIYANKQLDNSIYKELAKMTASKEPATFKLELGGSTMLVSFSESPEFNWKVISLVPISELQKKSQFVKNINISLLFMLVVFTFIISVVFSYLITRPLEKLMKSFKRLQKGDFNASVAVKGEDELAQIGITFNNMVSNIKDLIEQKYESNILRKQAELESLQSQINPHFLFNTLTSIKAVADKKDYEKASVMVQNLSDIFRYSLNRGRHIVKFSEELDHIKKYLYIQECRFAGKYDVYYDIDDEVLNYDIPRLTLQPIVENALYHGLEARRGKGELRIAAKLYNGIYYIYISDNGIGIKEEELEQINSLLESDPEVQRNEAPEKLGIFNVNARIKFHFGNNYGLKIISSAGPGTTVRITLPASNGTFDSPDLTKGEKYVENLSS